MLLSPNTMIYIRDKLEKMGIIWNRSLYTKILGSSFWILYQLHDMQ